MGVYDSCPVLQEMDWAGEKIVYSKAAYFFSPVLESSSCLFLHLGPSICCNPRRVGNAVCCFYCSNTLSSVSQVLLATWSSPFPSAVCFFCTTLYYSAPFHTHWNSLEPEVSLGLYIWTAVLMCGFSISTEPTIGFMLIADHCYPWCLSNWVKGCQGILRDQPFPPSAL